MFGVRAQLLRALLVLWLGCTVRIFLPRSAMLASSSVYAVVVCSSQAGIVSK